MKRWGILLLTLAMLFTIAGAEEVFMEESFLDAGVQGEEFFSEESFFGDAFEAEAPEDGAKTEAEDRSIYLMESETPPDAELATDWQKWYIKVTPDAVKPGSKKITLNFSLFTDKACTVPATPAGKIGTGAYAGVKFYIYDVDPYSGIPVEVAKKATTAMKTKITVKNPGDYTFYVRLEKVDATGSELYGHASEKVTVTVAETDKDYAISKMKLTTGDYYFYAETDIVPDKPTIIARYSNYDIEALVYTKKAADRYLVTAQTQGGTLYTGTYTLDPDEKLRVFLDGYFWLDFGSVNWGYNTETKEYEYIPDPVITSKGKKLTFTITPEKGEKDPETGITTYTAIGKAKKTAVKLTINSKVTPKTSPVIYYVDQIDATTVEIEWFDPASFYYFKPTGYTLTYGKTKVPLTLDKITQYGEGGYFYRLEMAAPVTKPTKMKFTVQAATEDKVKPKKSKAYTKMILPQSGFYVYNVDMSQFYDKYDEVEHINYSGVRVEWKGLYDTVDTYEVYLTDSKHTTDIAKKKISADKSKAESYDKDNGRYFVEFKKEEYEALTDGTRLGVVVKALAKDGSVLGRSTDYYYGNMSHLTAVTIEQIMESAEYKGGYNFYNSDLFKGIDADGKTYTNAVKFKKILFNDGTNPEVEVTEIKEIGKYKITIEPADDYRFADPKAAETEYTFEVKKRNLVVSLYYDNIVLADAVAGYDFDAWDLRIQNGDKKNQDDSFTLMFDAKVTVKNSKGEVVEGNLIKETGDYTAEVILTADPATTDGLTATSDPKKGTMTLTLPFTVSAKKLYIHAEAEQTGWVGESYNTGTVYGGPEYRITDVNKWDVDDSPYYDDPDVTFTVTGKDGAVKLGDMSKKAGEYTVTIGATCEGWEDADPVTVKITIVETQNTTLEGSLNTASYPYGGLNIHADSYTQYKEHDGSSKLPDFTIVDDGGKEVTVKYFVEIYDDDGNRIDSAKEIGHYDVDVVTDEPGYANTSNSFDLYITEPWTLSLKETSVVETGSSIYPTNDPGFKATSGKTEFAINDSTQKTYVQCNMDWSTLKKDGVEDPYGDIRMPGVYTFEVNARVMKYDDDLGYHVMDYTYAPIKEKEYTLTVTEKWSLRLTSPVVVENGNDLKMTGYADGVLKFEAKDSKGTVIKSYAEDPTNGWQYSGISDIEYYDEEYNYWDNTISEIRGSGKYKFKVWATWDSVYKYFECELTVEDAYTVTPPPATTTLKADGKNHDDELISLFVVKDAQGQTMTYNTANGWKLSGISYTLLKDGIEYYVGSIFPQTGTYVARGQTYWEDPNTHNYIYKNFKFPFTVNSETWTLALDPIELTLSASVTDITTELEKALTASYAGGEIPHNDSSKEFYFTLDYWGLYEQDYSFVTSIYSSDTLDEAGIYTIRMNVSLHNGTGSVPTDLYNKEYATLTLSVKEK